MNYYDDEWECDGCEAVIPRQIERCPRCGHPVGPRKPKVQCICGEWVPKPPDADAQCKSCNRFVR